MPTKNQLVGVKKVCVIGAGLSGLATIRELKEENHQVLCFEKESAIGGAFFSRDNKYGAYDWMLLTISNYFMSYSSLPPEEPERRYWSRQEYCEYLARYADQNDLLDDIVFDAEVERVTRRDNGTWLVEARVQDELRREVFDAVAICSGKFRVPKIPEFPGLESFQGEVLHPSTFKHANDLWDKDVVCVGLGETGADVCHQIAQVAATATVVLRHPPKIIARNTLPFTGRDDTNDAVTCRLLYGWYDFDYKSPSTPYLKQTLREWRDSLRSTETMAPDLKLYEEWNKMSGDQNQFLTKNDIFVNDIVQGKLRFNLFGIERLEENHVVCGDGEKIKADVLMCCTGYTDDFSFIVEPAEAREVETNHRILYKHMFHPKVGSGLAFIGFVRPAAGGVPVCAELQARFLARVLNGKLHLPSSKEMVKEARIDEEAELSYYPVHPHLKELIIFFRFVDDLADRIGCRPSVWKMALDPVLLFKYYIGSAMPFFFRLEGPGSMRRMAKRTIKTMPTGYTLRSGSMQILGNFALRSLSLLDRILGGAISRRAKARRKQVQAFLADELETVTKAQDLPDGAPLRSLCSDDIEWNNLKYKLNQHFAIDPKRMTLETTVQSLRDLEAEGSSAS